MKFVLFLILTVTTAHTSADESEFAAFIKQQELQYAEANGVRLAYKSMGDKAATPVLMIMGLGATHVTWGDQVVNGLLGEGYRVILFDNRDVGASQHLDELGDPLLWWEFLKLYLGFEVSAGYTLHDMAADSIALLDALGIDKAHVVGASMGGMIAQIVAADYENRVYTLTSIMSSTGAPHLPQASDETADGFGDTVGGENDNSDALHAVGIYPESMPRQLLAILKTGDRSQQVARIRVPTLVVHGEKDTLLPPAHGQHTSELIEGSELVMYEEMGHNLPETVVPDMVIKMDALMSGVTGDTIQAAEI